MSPGVYGALTNTNLGGLFKGSFRFISLDLCKKLQIWHISTHTYVVLENIRFSTKALLSVFSPKWYLYSKKQC